MKFGMRAAVLTAGTALTLWGFGATAQAAIPTSTTISTSGVEARGTIQCRPDSHKYTVKRIAPVRKGPSLNAAQIDVRYPNNEVHSYNECVNGGKIFICIASCHVSDEGIRGQWMFRGDVR
ncbi:hypothetical protein ACFV30_31125 [Streptomyces sp. NPDC059752]|uniref:hypothetical protein n=1 Tax=unclassified Streptomyces TaxID=2593676 RepID=UPI003665971C